MKMRPWKTAPERSRVVQWGERMNSMKSCARFLAIFLLACQGFNCSAKSSISETQVVDEATVAIDACHHWGGEVGDQSDERNEQIRRGAEHDCQGATKKGRDAYRLYPRNSALAAKLLELIDVDRFPVTAVERTEICETATAQFKRDFLGSNREDVLFRAECPSQASTLYRK